VCIYIAGSTFCTRCTAGKFSAVVGATDVATCSNCEAGKFSAAKGATTASACADCGFGTFSALGAANCTVCNAPAGNVCLPGSRSTEGTACPGNLVCPGGALGGVPVAVISVGCAAAAFFVGTFYVADDMSRPETCGGCGEWIRCTKPELRVVKGRAVSSLLAVASWFLLAVLTGVAVPWPWVSPDLAVGMIGIAVVATLWLAVAVPVLYLIVLPRFIKKRICCLCQMGGNLKKVHIDISTDIEANNNWCQHCKRDYKGIHRAPGGVCPYDVSSSVYSGSTLGSISVQSGATLSVSSPTGINSAGESAEPSSNMVFTY
jgi:hypothetical protein